LGTVVDGRVCWVITSVMTFREVYQVHKSAVASKAIGLEEQPEADKEESVTHEYRDGEEG